MTGSRYMLAKEWILLWIQMKNYSEGRWLAKGHLTRNCQCLELNWVSLAPKPQPVLLYGLRCFGFLCSQPSESTHLGYFNSRHSLTPSSGKCIATSLRISTLNCWNWIYAMDPKTAISYLRWFRNNNPAYVRIWFAKRSHQIGWQSIWSAAPAVLDNMGIVGEINPSLQSYSWKLHLKQDHEVFLGQGA